MVTTPLRERMRSILRSRNYSPRTEEAYIHAVARFARHFGRSPDQLGAAEVTEYQIWMREHNCSASLVNQFVCGVKFLFGEVLGREQEITRIRYARQERQLPVVLSPEEMARLLAAIPAGKYRVLASVLCATGLRISEAVSLRGIDVDSRRMVIRIRQGKGKKDRYVPLSPHLLEMLREHWKLAGLKDLLFPSRRNPTRPMDPSIAQRTIKQAGRRIGKHVSPHILRHSYATYQIEHGASPRVVQVILGHSNVRTTEIYMHVSPQMMGRTVSPLDEILPLLEKE